MPQEAARRIISTPSPAQSQGGSHKKFPPSCNTGGTEAGWVPGLWGAHQQPQSAPWAHAVASKGGHIPGCPIPASSRATGGTSRAGTVLLAHSSVGKLGTQPYHQLFSG